MSHLHSEDSFSRKTEILPIDKLSWFIIIIIMYYYYMYL